MSIKIAQAHVHVLDILPSKYNSLQKVHEVKTLAAWGLQRNTKVQQESSICLEAHKLACVTKWLQQVINLTTT